MHIFLIYFWQIGRVGFPLPPSFLYILHQLFVLIQHLMEMFPSAGRDTIQSIVADAKSIDSAIDVLLCRTIGPQNGKLTMSTLLREHRAKYLSDGFSDLTMSRACISNKANVFYKSCLHEPQRLRKALCIEFNGEAGIDAGALKNDFFLEYFRYIKKELFEGQENRLLPKNVWGADTNYQMAGAAIAHSLVLGGPGFGVIHPAVYSHLVALAPENVSDFPCADDIPLNAASNDTKEFIDKVCFPFGASM